MEISWGLKLPNRGLHQPQGEQNGSTMGISWEQIEHAQKYQQLPAVTSLRNICLVKRGNQWILGDGNSMAGHVGHVLTSRWFYSNPPTIASPYLSHTHVTYVHDESRIPSSKFARGLGRMLRKEACLLNRALCLIKAERFEIWNQIPNLTYPYISHDNSLYPVHSYSIPVKWLL